MLTKPCPECGFDPADVERAALPAIIRDAVSRWPAVLDRPDTTLRPEPVTWSPLEYACHIRDVCRVFAGRVRLMQEHDSPQFANWDQDASAIEGRYWAQDPTTVSEELAAAGQDAVDAFSRIGDQEWERAGRRSDGAQFTIETLGRYFVHDLLHHVWDVARRT